MPGEIKLRKQGGENDIFEKLCFWYFFLFLMEILDDFSGENVWSVSVEKIESPIDFFSQN